MSEPEYVAIAVAGRLTGVPARTLGRRSSRSGPQSWSASMPSAGDLAPRRSPSAPEERQGTNESLHPRTPAP
jgi:hypothetical protein